LELSTMIRSTSRIWSTVTMGMVGWPPGALKRPPPVAP
jgi:hypothetical protein